MQIESAAVVAKRPAWSLSRAGCMGFSVDHIMPAQWIKTPAEARTPEHALLVAFMQRNLDDLDTTTHAGNSYEPGRREETMKRIRKDALRWFLSDEAGWPFSFLRVCEYMRLDPEAVRAEARRRYEGKSAGVPRYTRHAVGARRRLRVAKAA